jgi:HTH-type transcriptional regulator / antitoxin HigA
VLKIEADYEAAIRKIEALLDEDPKPESEGHDRLDLLSLLAHAYEEEHEPPGRVTPQEAVEFMLQQKGMSGSDLSELMRGRSRVSEFFSGRRNLSKAQVEALHRRLGIPAEVLLGF